MKFSSSDYSWEQFLNRGGLACLPTIILCVGEIVRSWFDGVLVR